MLPATRRRGLTSWLFFRTLTSSLSTVIQSETCSHTVEHARSTGGSRDTTAAERELTTEVAANFDESAKWLSQILITSGNTKCWAENDAGDTLPTTKECQSSPGTSPTGQWVNRVWPIAHAQCKTQTKRRIIKYTLHQHHATLQAAHKLRPPGFSCTVFPESLDTVSDTHLHYSVPYQT